MSSKALFDESEVSTQLSVQCDAMQCSKELNKHERENAAGRLRCIRPIEDTCVSFFVLDSLYPLGVG
jgi:hypothetical protein